MLKRLVLLSLLLLAVKVEAAIVGKASSSVTSMDSLTVPLLSLDSIGNPITADSFFVLISKNGTITLRDSGTTSLTGIVTMATTAAWGSQSYYVYRRQVSDLVSTAGFGNYSGIIIARKHSPYFSAQTNFQFDVVNRNLTLALDSVYQVLSMIRAGLTINGTQTFSNTGTWTGNVTGSVGSIAASGLTALGDTIWSGVRKRSIDSPRNSNLTAIDFDSNAANNLKPMLNGTGGKTLSLGRLVISTGLNVPAVSIQNTCDTAGGGAGIQIFSNASDGINIATINAGAHGDYGYGIRIRNDGVTRHGIPAVLFDGAEGPGFRIIGADSFPAMDIIANQGGGYIADGVRIRTHGIQGSKGISVTSDSGTALSIVAPRSGQTGMSVSGGSGGYGITANIHGAIDTARNASSTGSTDTSAIKTLAQNNPSYFYGPSSAGSGAFTHTIVTFDSANHQTLSGASVAIRNLSQSALFAVSRTNPQGEVAFNLNSASYLAIADAAGYLFHPFDTITVTGAGRDTLFAHRFDPGAPASSALCRVYGYVYTLSSLPEPAAIVSASLPGGVVRSGSLVISPFSVSTTTDSLGYFFLDLIPSDSLTPSATKYEITISRPDGSILRQRLRIPSVSSWRLDW